MERFLTRWPIRYLYFGIAVIFSICLFIVIFSVSYHFSTKAIVNTASSHQEKMLLELNHRLEAQLNYIESISLAISQNSDMIELLGDHQKNYYNYALSQRVSLDLLGLTFSTLSVNGIHVYMKDPPSSMYPVMYYPIDELMEEPWYPSLRQNEFLWIGKRALQTPAGMKQVVSFARSLSSSSGEFAGVAVIHVNADMLQQSVGDEEQSSQRLLIDANGEVIAQVGDPSITLQEEDLEKIVNGKHEITLGQRVMSEKWKLSSGSVLLIMSRLSGSDWIVAELTPWNELTKDSVAMLKLLTIIAILSIILLLLIHLLINRWFTKPIFLLLRNMNRYPDLDSKLTVKYENEFGQLFQGYNRLIDRTQQLYVSLDEQHKRKRETEIKAFQAMIHPHFLYNTLDQLNWMAIKDGNEKMSKVLEMTGGLLRIGLSEGEPLIPLVQELKIVEYYIQIQQIRLGEKNIRYRINVPEDLGGLLVPKMTLQPFIENSIKHGFHGKDYGQIDLDVVLLPGESRIMITIADDGKGLDQAKLGGRKTLGGYGIHNVRARLESFFQADYAIELAERDSGGAIVRIVMPKLLSPTTGEMDTVDKQ